MKEKASMLDLCLCLVLSSTAVCFVLLLIYHSYEQHMQSVQKPPDLSKLFRSTRIKPLLQVTKLSDRWKSSHMPHDVYIQHYAPRHAFNNSHLPEAYILHCSLQAAEQKGHIVPYTRLHSNNDHGTAEKENAEYFLYDRTHTDPCYVHCISLKYNPLCGNDSLLPARYIKSLLVVAVQRSGTHYMWEMLQRLGVDVHHEGVGRHGAVSWLYAVNAHYNSTADVYDYGHGYIINNPEALHRNRFRIIFHQVRHPLRVITTLVRRCSSWDRYWQWIHSLRGFEQIHADLSPLKRAMLLYILWNRHIEQYADLRYRSEVTSARDVCIWAGLQAVTHCYGDFKPVTHTHHNATRNTNTSHNDVRYMQDHQSRSNSRATQHIAGRAVSWANLDQEDVALSNELKVMCLEYGYPLDPALVPQAEHTKQFTA